MKTVLESLRKHQKLSKRRYELMASKYTMTEKARDNAQMEYELEPEYTALCLEIDKLQWQETLRKLDENIRKTEQLLAAKERRLGEAQNE